MILHENKYVNEQMLYFDRAIERIIEEHEIKTDFDGLKRCIKLELREAYRKGFEAGEIRGIRNCKELAKKFFEL